MTVFDIVKIQPNNFTTLVYRTDAKLIYFGQFCKLIGFYTTNG